MRFNLKFLIAIPIIVFLATQLATLVVEKQRVRRSWKSFAQSEVCTPQWVFEIRDVASGTVLNRLGHYSNQPTEVRLGEFEIDKRAIQWTFLIGTVSPVTITIDSTLFLAVQVATICLAIASFYPIANWLRGNRWYSVRYSILLPLCTMFSIGALYWVFVPELKSRAGVLVAVKGPAVIIDTDTNVPVRKFEGISGGTRLSEGRYQLKKHGRDAKP